jgi:hypothetical protein
MGMKYAWLLLASTLLAQSGNKLEADLLALSGAPTAAVNQQLTNDILSLAETIPQPSRRVVNDFVDELTRALAGQKLDVRMISQLSTSIFGVLQSDRVTTTKYREYLDLAHKALLAMGVPEPAAKRVIDRLAILGQQVRGPEDLPLLQEFRSK